jgi:hypothetical protein
LRYRHLFSVEEKAKGTPPTRIWLDPEPSGDSSDYETYIEELQRIERRGYDHSTIEEEFRRLSDITDRRRCFMPQSKKQGALGVQPLLLGNDEMKI